MNETFKNKKAWVLIFCSMQLSFVACVNNDFDDLEKYAAQINARKPSPIEPLPEIKKHETFLYNKVGLRNPFQKQEKPDSLAEIEAGVGPGPDLDREKESLEAYPLDTLRMVGTVFHNSKLWGLVRTGDKVIHRVLPGDYMGQNYGKIVSLNEELIELNEFVKTSGKRWRERQASLAIVE